MKAELKASGMSEEEILAKTAVLMKAFKRSDPSADIAQYALASKMKNSALKKNNTSPKDFTLVIIRIYSTMHDHGFSSQAEQRSSSRSFLMKIRNNRSHY